MLLPLEHGQKEVADGVGANGTCGAHGGGEADHGLGHESGPA